MKRLWSAGLALCVLTAMSGCYTMGESGGGGGQRPSDIPYASPSPTPLASPTPGTNGGQGGGMDDGSDSGGGTR